MLGFEPRSEGSHTPVISATFTRPCSRLKPVRVPGIEPGSKGSKPLMLSVTPHPHEAGILSERTPPGSESRECKNAGLHWFEGTLIRSNWTAMPIPPAELSDVHCAHLFSQQNPISRLPIKMLCLEVHFLRLECFPSIMGIFQGFTRRVIVNIFGIKKTCNVTKTPYGCPSFSISNGISSQ